MSDTFSLKFSAQNRDVLYQVSLLQSLLEGAVGFYADAACTQNYDPFGDTDSDLTIYVKWTE